MKTQPVDKGNLGKEEANNANNANSAAAPEDSLDAKIKELSQDRSLASKERARRIEQLELAKMLKELIGDRDTFSSFYEFFRRVDMLSRSWHVPFDDGLTDIAQTAGINMRAHTRKGRSFEVDIH